MSNLAKIMDTWDKIDNVYEVKGGGKTKRDFLMRLVSPEAIITLRKRIRDDNLDLKQVEIANNLIKQLETARANIDEFDESKSISSFVFGIPEEPIEQEPVNLNDFRVKLSEDYPVRAVKKGVLKYFMSTALGDCDVNDKALCTKTIVSIADAIGLLCSSTLNNAERCIAAYIINGIENKYKILPAAYVVEKAHIFNGLKPTKKVRLVGTYKYKDTCCVSVSCKCKEYEIENEFGIERIISIEYI